MNMLDYARLAAGLTVLGAGSWLAGRRIVFLVRLLRKARPMPDRMGGTREKIHYQLIHVLGQRKLLR